MLYEDIAVALSGGATFSVPAAKAELKVKRVELVVRCQELARFLRGFEETAWAEWVERRIQEIRSGQLSGIKNLLAAYCGIGNIGDVFLCPEAGHRIKIPDENSANEQLLLMLSKVNLLARQVDTLSRPFG